MIRISLDPGFGNTKLFDGTTAVVIPSSVTTGARSIGRLAGGMETKPALEVSWGEHTYKIGGNAYLWGAEQTANEYATLFDIPRMALLYAGLAQLGISDGTEIGLTIGLPVSLLSDSKQFDYIKPMINALKGVHEFSYTDSGGTTNHRMSITNTRTLPQPLGGWANSVWDDRLVENSTLARIDLGVIDVGMNTVDLYVVGDGAPRAGLIDGADFGFRTVLRQKFKAGMYGLSEADSLYRSKKYIPTKSELDEWIAKIMDLVNSKWGERAKALTVVLVGGGISVLGNRLTAMLESKGIAVITPSDPVTANVRGLWKFTQARSKK